MSELALKLIAECKKNKSPKLDLGNCGLTDLNDIKKELYELGGHLEELNFANARESLGFKETELIESKNEGPPNELRNNIDLSIFQNLKELYYCDYDERCHLTDLGFIEENIELKILDLSGNFLKNIEPIWNLTRLNKLNLSGNFISDIGPINRNKDLTHLNLSGNFISDIFSLFKLKKLRYLNVSRNEIKDIQVLSQLTSLEDLEMNGNQISDLFPLRILNLKQDKTAFLKRLDLSSNLVKDIGPLGSINSMLVLYLSSNQIVDLNALKNNEKLQSLDISGNLVSDLAPLSGLEFLVYLYAPLNKIISLNLNNFNGLKELNLWGNQLSNIDEINPKSQIEYLDISRNHFQDLGSICSLTSLKTLRFDYNNVSELFPLRKLKNLSRVSFNANIVEDLSPLKQLTNLKYICFGDAIGRFDDEKKGNLVTDVEPLLNFFKHKDCQIIGDFNPLTKPPIDIYKRGREAILNWFKIKNKIPNDQVKLIFLGNCTVGKSSLIKFLTKGEYDPQEITTHGITQTQWKQPISRDDSKNMNINIWDFGGQHYYHSMHRLFLTRGSVYVVAATSELDKNDNIRTEINYENGRKEPKMLEHFHHSYWLKSISYHERGTASKVRSFVQLLQTKAIIERFSDPNRLQFKSSHFRNELDSLDIQDFIPINVAAAYLIEKPSQGRNEKINQLYKAAFDSFKLSLLDALEKNMQGLGEEIPPKFPQIRDYLYLMASGDLTSFSKAEKEMLHGLNIAWDDNQTHILPFMSDEKLKDLILRISHEEDYEDVGFDAYYELLLIYLDSMCGSIVIFKNLPFKPQRSESVSQDGKGMVCVQPQWLHDMIYKIFDRAVVENACSFTLEHVDNCLEGGILEAEYMIFILKSFDLIFEYEAKAPIEHADRDIPSDSPVQTFYLSPHVLPIDEPSGLKKHIKDLEVALTFTFSSYMPPDVVARFIAREAIIAEVSSIELWKYGMLYYNEFDSMRTLVRTIRSENKVEVSLPKGIEERTKKRYLKKFFDQFYLEICKANPEVEITLAGYSGFTAGHLKRATSEIFSNDGTYIKLDQINWLLSIAAIPKIRIFISYSHKNLKEAAHFSKLLEEHLTIQGIDIEKFIDLKLVNGEEWDKQLKGKLDDCDILLCLISHGFINSEYIQEHEFGRKLEEIKQGSNAEIVLVKLEWYNEASNLSLNAFQHFPSNPIQVGWPEHNKKPCFGDFIDSEGNPTNAKLLNKFVQTLIDEVLSNVVKNLAAKKRLFHYEYWN